MKRIWWMNAFGMMFDPRSGDRTTIEQILGTVVSVTAAHSDDRDGMVDYTYIVVTDEPTIGEMMGLPALPEVLIIGQDSESREEVIVHPNCRCAVMPMRSRVWMKCHYRRLD